MRASITIGVLIICIVLGFIFQDEPFMFKAIVFISIAAPILYALLLMVLQEHENKIKSLENRIYDLENRK